MLGSRCRRWGDGIVPPSGRPPGGPVRGVVRITHGAGDDEREPGIGRPASTAFAWPAPFAAALSLSFDDARRSQLRWARPVLGEHGVRATFFVLPKPVAARRRSWSRLFADGHEVGNHTVRHPCRAELGWRGRTALEDLGLDDLRADAEAANRELHGLVGVAPRVFAYPCGDTDVGQGSAVASYVPVIAELFDVGRTFNDRGPNQPDGCDLARVACVNIDGCQFEDPRAALDPDARRRRVAGRRRPRGRAGPGPGDDGGRHARGARRVVCRPRRLGRHARDHRAASARVADQLAVLTHGRGRRRVVAAAGQSRNSSVIRKARSSDWRAFRRGSHVVV